MECLDLRQSAKISLKNWSLVTFCLAMGFYIQWIPVANRDHWALTDAVLPFCLIENSGDMSMISPCDPHSKSRHYIPQTSENERILHIHHIYARSFQKSFQKSLPPLSHAAGFLQDTSPVCIWDNLTSPEHPCPAQFQDAQVSSRFGKLQFLLFRVVSSKHK